MDKLLENELSYRKKIQIIKDFYYKNYMLKDKQKDIKMCQNWMTRHNINFLFPSKKSVISKSQICLE
tara:strand:+ start:314 stop:514 length:201 start_codon:yes stop_codon:yes gene_type:complete